MSSVDPRVVKHNARVERYYVERDTTIVMKKKSQKSRTAFLDQSEAFSGWWYACLCSGSLGVSSSLGTKWPVAHVPVEQLMASFVRWLRQHRAQALQEIEDSLDEDSFETAVLCMLPGPMPAMIGRIRIPPLKVARSFFSQQVAAKPPTWSKQ